MSGAPRQQASQCVAASSYGIVKSVSSSLISTQRMSLKVGRALGEGFLYREVYTIAEKQVYHTPHFLPAFNHQLVYLIGAPRWRGQSIPCSECFQYLNVNEILTPQTKFCYIPTLSPTSYIHRY